MSIPPTDTAEASTLSGIRSQSSSSTVDVQFAEMKYAMQKMAETVSSKLTLVAALNRHIANNGGIGNGRGSGGRNGGIGGVGGHTTI